MTDETAHNEPVPDGNPKSTTVSKRSSSIFALSLIVILLMMAGGCYGIYFWQHDKIRPITARTASLNSQIADEQRLVSALRNKNLGIVLTPVTQNQPNQISLAGGKVSFILPSGWVRATVPDFNNTCVGGLSNSAPPPLCIDIATIIPAPLNVHHTSIQPIYRGAYVTVNQFMDSTSAEKWFNDIVTADKSSSDLMNVSTQPINGYSAICSTDRNMNNNGSVYYETAGCAVVHGVYVVGISSQVINHDSPDGSPRTNDYTQYITGIYTFAKTVKLQD